MVAALGLVAVRALLQLRHRQRVVRPSIALTGVRHASLGDSHVLEAPFVSGLLGWTGRMAARVVRLLEPVAERRQRREPRVDVVLDVMVGRLQVEVRAAFQA